MLIEKANRAKFALNNKAKLKQIPVKTALRLFDAVVLPILAYQPVENRRKKCHRFWLRLRSRHALILISNDRTSTSKKINEMALIRTLTVSTTAFERTK